jgi:hypothetical protein
VGVAAKTRVFQEIRTIVHENSRLIAYCHQPKKPAIALDHNLLLPA